MAYIQLPRSCAYVNLRYLKPRIRGCAIDLNADYRQFTLLPAVSDDEPLVCSYLEHFFLTEAIYTPYVEYIRDMYLDGGRRWVRDRLKCPVGSILVAELRGIGAFFADCQFAANTQCDAHEKQRVNNRLQVTRTT